MTFSLFPVLTVQLHVLARGDAPADLAPRAEPGAFPPAFVAQRALTNEADHPSMLRPSLHHIVRTADGRIVGSCGFKHPPQGGRVELGYGVAPSARGAGAATAALDGLARLAFAAGLTEVLAEILPTNAASIRVAQKAGFRLVGTRTDESDDLVGQWVRRAEG